jgi:hypothetical protein
MADSATTPETAGKPLPAKKKERSAAYPAITIEQSVKFVAEIYKNFRKDFTKRDDILSLVEGSHPRHIAASVYYLFLNREADTYQVSDAFRKVLTPINEQERRSTLLTSFEAPKLYKALIEKFDGDEIPKELTSHLSRFYEITEDAAPLAAEVFIKNAQYVGVLSDKNFLSFNGTKLSVQTGALPAEKPGEAELPSPSGGEVNVSKGAAAPIAPEEKQQLLLPEMANEERVKVRLTRGRFAWLIHPLDLTNTDVQILEKEIEKLKLIANSY